jgi:hypothetical protein
MGRSENAASRWAQGCMLPWPHCGPKGRGSERGSRPCWGGWHAGRARVFRGAIPAIDPEQLARKHAVHGATSTPCYSALSHRSEPGEKAVSYRLPFDRTWVIAN